MTERQTAINDLYRQFREAGDDVMNASLRVMDHGAASEQEALEARRNFGDPDDMMEDGDVDIDA